MKLEKYSIGVGDRFGHQAKAQLEAIIKTKKLGLELVPVWNKSFREHEIISTKPEDVRAKADQAVKEKNWQGSYYVDADHINISNVDLFIDSCDFFTLDVADYIGQSIAEKEIDEFVNNHKDLIGSLEINGIEKPLKIDEQTIRNIASKTLKAIKKAGELYRYIESQKGKDNFVTEVSMDETEFAQTPIEMFFILAAISDEKIPAQTIAPKFTGRFNKGVDYVGDVEEFAQEFNDNVAILKYAKENMEIPENIKLSVHSGSDKFAIYDPINKVLKKYDAGIHIKTAGTTWLEELIGLADAGNDGLEIAKEIYIKAFE